MGTPHGSGREGQSVGGSVCITLEPLFFVGLPTLGAKGAVLAFLEVSETCCQ